MRCAVMIIIGLLVAPAGWAGNLLPNPTLEEGEKSPKGWGCWGGGGQGWEVGAPEGKRYVVAAGDGANESGWYALSRAKVEPNRVYGASFLVRKEPGTNGGLATAGLSRAKQQFSVPGGEWERKVVHFRSPDVIAGMRFEVGQRAADGAIGFDDIQLFPSIPIYRSGGHARYLLGADESLVNRRYLAADQPGGAAMEDHRFLYRASADYQGDRWVLNKSDMLIYIHHIDAAGYTPIIPQVRGDIAVTTSTQSIRPNETSGWTDVSQIHLGRPDDSHRLEQEGIVVELDVAQCQGSLLVEFAPGTNGPWWAAKAIDTPGTYQIPAPKNLLNPSRTVVVRMTALAAKRIEVTGYRYRSSVVQQEAREPIYGETHYVDIVHDSPTLACGLVDPGDMAPEGRNEVRLKIRNQGTRRRLVLAATVMRGTELISREEQDLTVGVGTETLRSVAYRVAPQGKQTLSVTLRDAKSDELLVELRSEFGREKGEDEKRGGGEQE